MNKTEWKNNVLRTIEHIASERYQEESWFGKGEKVSSPEELYCELFDDDQFEAFLHTPELQLTPLQKDAGIKLKNAMEKFSKQSGETMDPEKVFSDPMWEKIRKIANDFLTVMRPN
jgi:hypothetical protein